TIYTKMLSQTNEANDNTPSTPCKMELANLLAYELKAIGMEDVSVDDNGYVMATLSATTDKKVPTIGFLAHIDTATDFTGKDVQPQIVEHYDGNDIQLNEEVKLSTQDFPELTAYKKHTLIKTYVSTLLEIEYKVGNAENMNTMEHIINHPEIKQGRIRVAFTHDEEISRRPHIFNVDRFDATYAYTIDG